MKVLPINLKKNDLDIEFETKLPYFGSKYLIIQAGINNVVTKQIVFKDEVNSLFIQTQTQTEPPTSAQAIKLAKNFGAVVIDSKNNLFSIAGKNSSGIIGYCPNVHQLYVAYSTTKESINITCKKTNEE